MARSVFRLVGPGNVWERTTGELPLDVTGLAPDTAYTFDAGEGSFTVTTDPSASTPADLFGSGETGYWLHANGTTVWTDTAATTQATAGQLVARVDDASGNGNNATQATTTNRPQFSATDGLTFDGTDDLLNVPAFSATDFTLCLGVRINVSGVAFAAGSSTGDTKFGILNGVWFLRSAPGGSSITGGTAQTATPYVITAIRSGGTQTIRVNGAQVATGATATDAASFNIWGDDGFGARWNGSSKALLGINRALAGADLGETEGYMASIMGVTL